MPPALNSFPGLVGLSGNQHFEFAYEVIDNNDESDGSGGKLRSSKISEENNGGISTGWSK